MKTLSAINMDDAILNNKSRSIWTEVKNSVNGHNSQIVSVDSSTEKQRICNIFGEKYKTLHSSVPYDIDQMCKLQEDIQNQVDSHCVDGYCYDKYCIKVGNVCEAARKLKGYKGHGIQQCFLNNSINAPHISYIYLGLLFNCMFVHSAIPDEMLLGTIIYIIKYRQKSNNDSNNFRATT